MSPKNHREPRIQLPLTFTKTQLIKKLKEDGNFTVEFVQDLDVYDKYIWKRGDAYELQDVVGTKAFDTKYYKIKDTLLDILIILDPTKDSKAKDKALEYIERSIPNEDYNAIVAMLKRGSIELTADEIYNIDFETLKYETSGDEFISISVGASVWTYYIQGSFETQGKLVEVRSTRYGGDTNRL